jgi:Spy/CpxP family protein refolding chaperone
MTLPLRTFIGMLALTVVAAALAGWLGVQYGIHQVQPRADLDIALHEKLSLTSDQDRKISAIERRFDGERDRLQAEMRNANRDLATSITIRHVYDVQAQQAIVRFHHAMTLLQEDTVRHVLAMRAVLTPDQAKQFDQIIAKSLTADAP